MIVSLIGFMGSGKSSVGRKLAALLSYSFIDLDSEIEKKEGMSIGSIFSAYGEPAFRAVEADTLASVLDIGENLVIATGGGTPVLPVSSSLLHDRTVCIYLRAEAWQLSEILSVLDNANRPLLKSHTVEELLESRMPVYENTAHIVVNLSDFTTGVPDDEIFGRIAGRLVFDLGKEKCMPGD